MIKQADQMVQSPGLINFPVCWEEASKRREAAVNAKPKNHFRHEQSILLYSQKSMKCSNTSRNM